MGTPEFSVAALIEIIRAGHEVVAVYTQPPRPAGRGQKEHISAVHTAALEYNIPVFTPKSLKDIAAQKEFIKLHPFQNTMHRFRDKILLHEFL